MTRPIHCGAVILGVDAVKGGGHPVGIAFAPYLPVRNYIDTRSFLIADGEEGGGVLGLLQEFLGNPPNLFCADSRGQSFLQVIPVNQPFGLNITADNRCG